MKKALLIIDVQNDYFPNGNCELSKPEEALKYHKKITGIFQETRFTCFLYSALFNSTGNFFCSQYRWRKNSQRY